MPHRRVLQSNHEKALKARKKAKKEKTERVREILLKNKEKGLRNTNVMGYELDENNELIKI